MDPTGDTYNAPPLLLCLYARLSLVPSVVKPELQLHGVLLLLARPKPQRRGTYGAVHRLTGYARPALGGF